jgi:excinuclease UvrABC ATPase subunit
MCPCCSGIGRVVMPDVDTFLDLDRSLEDGAILLPGFGNGQYWYRQYADIGSFDASTPLGAWSPEEREALLYGGEAAAASAGARPGTTRACSNASPGSSSTPRARCRPASRP